MIKPGQFFAATVGMLLCASTAVAEPPAPPPAACSTDVGSLQAETDCPFFADFNAGVELLQDNNFSDVFPRVGLRLRSTLFEVGRDVYDNQDEVPAPKSKIAWQYDSVFRPHLLFDFGLSSRNVNVETTPAEDDASGDQGEPASSRAAFANQNGANGNGSDSGEDFELKGSLTFEGHGGFLVDLLDFYWEQAGASRSGRGSTLALLGQLGAISPKEGDSDLRQHHFAGARLYYRGANVFNGAAIDVGWGKSENFRENTDQRFKFRGYLPYRLRKSGTTSVKLFSALEMDTDFADGDDELKLIFGLSVPFEHALKLLPLGSALQRLVEGPQE